MIQFLFDGIYYVTGGEYTRIVAYYGIILMTGAMVGGWLASREAKRRGFDPEMVWDLLIYLIIGGVIGARLWHVFTPSPSAMIIDPVSGQLVNPYFAGGTIRILDILDIRHGGLGIPGAVIGGAIAMFFYARNHKLNFAEWADLAAPSLALGQAIGRFGNYFNQELYGAPTNLPWKLYIDPQHRLPSFASVEYYHPLFAYEAILNLLNMFLLIWVTRKYDGKSKKGDIFLVYLIVYPIIRFSLDFLRLDASMVGGININQTVMAVIALCAIAALTYRHRPGAKNDVKVVEPPQIEEAPIPVVDSVESAIVDEPVVVKKAAAQKPAAVKTTKGGTTRKSAAVDAPKKTVTKKTTAKRTVESEPVTKKPARKTSE